MGVPPDREATNAIDLALSVWRQGDLALDETWFMHIGDPGTPLTPAAAGAEGDGVQMLTSEVEGLAVLTQTCDVVRSCVERPYIEVAPVVRVEDDGLLGRVRRGQVPAWATVPALGADALAIHLDRVMTVEKSVVATWTRTSGCTNDVETRVFAQALARKRVRFAFPDDFTDLVAKLRGRLLGKHEKDSHEGRGLRALREIRVQATPDWEASQLALFFWFVREDAHADFEGKQWGDLLDSWLALVHVAGRFTRVDGLACTLEEMNAAEYVASDPLDLDHLSRGAIR